MQPSMSEWTRVKEFSRSGPFQARRSRYKLPALQILMLQEYPARLPSGQAGGVVPDEPTFSLNVQYSRKHLVWR